MARQKNDTPVFRAIVDGLEREYAFVYPKLSIPGRGVMTREEIMQDEALMAQLIQEGGDQFRLLAEKPAAVKAPKKAAKAAIDEPETDQ